MNGMKGPLNSPLDIPPTRSLFVDLLKAKFFEPYF